MNPTFLHPSAFDDYYKQWELNIKNIQEQKTEDWVSLVVFIVKGQYFAFLTHVVRNIMPPRRIYPIPHKTNHLLLGVVKAKRELQLVICLEALLFEDNRPLDLDDYRRYLFIQEGKNSIVFPVNSVVGLRTLPKSMWATYISKKNDRYLGDFKYNDCTVMIINHAMIFQEIVLVLKFNK